MQGLPLFAARRRNVFLYVCAIAAPLIFLVAMLSQSVFAQNTFVITDGDQVIVHTMYGSDPARALDEAGLDVAPDDYITTQTEDGVYDITVKRDDTVTVMYCGQKMIVPLQGDTVEELLELSQLQITPRDTLSCDLQDVPYDGMEISVDRVIVNRETYTVEIPYAVSYVADPYIPEGEEEILTKGVAGQMLYTAQVTYCNTKAIDRKILDKQQIRPAQKQIVARGTGELVGNQSDMPLIGDDVIVLPTGEVLTYYATDSYVATAYTQYDSGCDTITATQTPVRWGVVAVDPTVIPYGTRMFIVNQDGSFAYGLATAEDCGSAIKGKRLDLYMPTLEQANNYGRRDVTVYFLGDANWTY